MENSYLLSSGATTNANYPAAGFRFEQGGRYQFNARSSAWDGATVTLKYKPGGGHSGFGAITGASLTADGVKTVDFAVGDTVYATVTGAGASTNLILTLNKVVI